jgi:hypothetical protein
MPETTGSGRINKVRNYGNILKPQSAKSKGRNFQKAIREIILKMNPELGPDDVISKSMGANGEDIVLSTAARKLVPFQIECKHKREIAVCGWFEQAQEHGEYEPLLCIRENHGQPLVVVDAETFFEMVKTIYGRKER